VAHDLGHAEAPLIHRIRNVGGEAFRLIAVINSGPPAVLAGPEGEAALPGDLETEVEWFRQSRVTLAPGAESDRMTSRCPVVVVQVSSGRTDVFDGDGTSQTLAGPGSFAAAEPGHDFELRNSGTQPVTLVVVEAR
jgi:mannose-6-phosphate isomerase-like protein (cupin superfamily)